MYNIFLTEKELRLLLDLLCQNGEKNLAECIKEQIFKRDSEDEEYCNR